MIRQYQSEYPAGTFVIGAFTTAAVIDVKRWNGTRWELHATNYRVDGRTDVDRDRALADLGLRRTGEWVKDGLIHLTATAEAI